MESGWSLTEITWFLSWLGALMTVPSVLLQRAGRPTAALSWLLALFALPALAVIAWWLFGRTHLNRRRRRRRRAKQVTVSALRETRQQLLTRATLAEETNAPPRRAASLPPMLHEAVFPPAAGNSVALLADTKTAHHAWHDLVGQANHHLHLLFYIWRDDHTGRDLRDRLVEKARQGLEVRVLYDAVGSLGLPRHFFDPLTAAGGKAVAFMPIHLLSASPTLNFRNHRKLLIADGWRAFTGGINVGDEYLDWQDLGIVIEGPGVNQLQEVFVDDWYFSTREELAEPRYFFEPAEQQAMLAGSAVCETITSGPDQVFNATREMAFLAITQCRERLWIATPYFVPDEALLLALRSAVYRGVDVRLLLPKASDVLLVQRASRVYYPELLEGGVRIYEYDGMLHAKALLLDHDTVLIGSANLDTRSFRLNFELSTFISDTEFNQQLAALFEQFHSLSVPASLDDLRHASPLGRLRDVLAHLLSPLL